MLTVEQKAKIVAEFGRNPQDTGYPEVQIALLSARIADLQPHFEAHKRSPQPSWFTTFSCSAS